jgi:hypothetical protein
MSHDFVVLDVDRVYKHSPAIPVTTRKTAMTLQTSGGVPSMQFPYRSGAIKALAYRAALISALLALPVSIASAFTLTCTVSGTNGNDLFIVVSDTPDEPGEVAADAVICGRQGNDVLDFQQDSVVNFTGTFYGGKGDDFVDGFDRFDGTFLGGYGDDSMAVLVGQGFFDGGAGNDQLTSLVGGTFKGRSGNDVLMDLSSGSFFAGAGEDQVLMQGGGTYNGGRDTDTLQHICGGTQTSVEVIVSLCPP